MWNSRRPASRLWLNRLWVGQTRSKGRGKKERGKRQSNAECGRFAPRLPMNVEYCAPLRDLDLIRNRQSATRDCSKARMRMTMISNSSWLCCNKGETADFETQCELLAFIVGGGQFDGFQLKGHGVIFYFVKETAQCSEVAGGFHAAFEG